VPNADLLSPTQVAHAIGRLKTWQLLEGKLTRRFEFSDFQSAMVFVNEIADYAEEVNHHPNILIFYSTVQLELISHDVGGVSERDVQFCQQISEHYPD
jgi:4a-hydroxytetrahydrobiopterin dehydratase